MFDVFRVSLKRSPDLFLFGMRRDRKKLKKDVKRKSAALRFSFMSTTHS
jgi:hypothetical protein